MSASRFGFAIIYFYNSVGVADVFHAVVVVGMEADIGIDNSSSEGGGDYVVKDFDLGRFVQCFFDKVFLFVVNYAPVVVRHEVQQVEFLHIRPVLWLDQNAVGGVFDKFGEFVVVFVNVGVESFNHPVFLHSDGRGDVEPPIRRFFVGEHWTDSTRRYVAQTGAERVAVVDGWRYEVARAALATRTLESCGGWHNLSGVCELAQIEPVLSDFGRVLSDGD